ncbi:Glutathione S-transferase, N-terminal domain [Gemmobacter aquatilis]|uniref:Glutathione S-transferase, N-terminal domain n=1 Tax=Gemmobacter aquatilis TaxID=933059 RepID=A0A1H8MFH0_9RHOB|nr:glutathione S-transferase N-terminal domain-containing protein [Gemmobacter aquatilis]SEO16152.1 Glutathione S-transferase, N-terminal domain [Gemmobacter aquatilis]
MPLLHWSPRSPYVRKVMVALHEKGLAGQVETVRTHADPLIPHPGLMALNPLSKIPTLELEDGSVLFDSHVICRWADRAGPACSPKIWLPSGTRLWAPAC